MGLKFPQLPTTATHAEERKRRKERLVAACRAFAQQGFDDNPVCNLAGFVSPFVVGRIKDTTGSTNNCLHVIAASLVVGGAIVFAIARRGARRSGA